MSNNDPDGKTVEDTLLGAVGAVTVGDKAASRRIDGLSPSGVVYPEDLGELSGALAAAYQDDLAVAPWGGGTRIELGNLPERLDVVIHLSRLNRIVEHNPADLTATVQAGVTIENLQEALGQHGQFLAVDTALPDLATIGGVLAVGASGTSKWQYGSPRDTVIGMTVAQADGTVTKSGGQVVKNVSGYDMARLHVGAIGTLGIIAEISFKLTPLPVDEATVVAVYDGLGMSTDAGLAVFHSDIVPLAITTFDNIANDRMKCIDRSGTGFLAIRLGGRPMALERQVMECQSLCRQLGSPQIDVIRGSQAEKTWRSVADFGWDTEATPLVLCRVLLEPARVPGFLDALPRLQGLEGFLLAVTAQPAHGVVLLAWTADGEKPSRDSVTRLIRKSRETVHESNGRMLIERCPSDVKPRFDVWDEVGTALSTMRRLKEQYDPKRILSPGRFVGGI